MPQINYRDVIFTLLFDLVHGEDTDPHEVSDEGIEKIALVAENIVRITLLSAREKLGRGASVCELCECRVEGPMSEIRGESLCPGCTNYRTLMDQVMARGLGPSSTGRVPS